MPLREETKVRDLLRTAKVKRVAGYKACFIPPGSRSHRQQSERPMVEIAHGSDSLCRDSEEQYD
jgi:hypothetical protein